MKRRHFLIPVLPSNHSWRRLELIEVWIIRFVKALKGTERLALSSLVLLLEIDVATNAERDSRDRSNDNSSNRASRERRGRR